MSGVSSLGFFTSQNANISNLRSQLFTLQEQIATQQRSNNFAGLESEIVNVLSARSDLSRIESYQQNIDLVSSRIEVIDLNLTTLTNLGTDIRDAAAAIPRNAGDPDLSQLQTLVSTNSEFVEQLLNTEINGHFLFSGSAANVPPIESLSTLRTNIQTELDAFYAGTQTYEEAIANIDALSGTQAGYNINLDGADEITVRVDDNLDIDYTVLANEEGFENFLKSTITLELLDFPDPNDPTVFASSDDFYNALTDLTVRVSDSINQIQTTQARVSIANASINDAGERHTTERLFLGAIVSDIEQVDITEAIAQLQQVEVQLNATFQTLATISDLTLVNFI